MESKDTVYGVQWQEKFFSRDVTFDESTLKNKVIVEEVKQIDGASKQVEFEGKIFLLKESQLKRRFYLKNLNHNLNQ